MATDYIEQHVLHAAHVCRDREGRGGEGSCTPFIWRVGKILMWVTVPEKCISGNFERPGKEILAFTNICIISLFLWN